MSISRRAFNAALAGAGAVSAAPKSKRPPNIVYVLADDLGWGELGSYGNIFNKTPHLDRLAKEGIRFTHAYSAAPVCSPMRAPSCRGRQNCSGDRGRNERLTCPSSPQILAH